MTVLTFMEFNTNIVQDKYVIQEMLKIYPALMIYKILLLENPDD